MANKKTTKKKEKETPSKATKKKTTNKKKYTLVELCNQTTMPDNELILKLVDSGYYTQYKKELKEGAEPSLTTDEFYKNIIRR